MLVVVVATVVVNVTRKEPEPSISYLMKGQRSPVQGASTCGLQQDHFVALHLVTVGGSEENLVVGTGPEASDDVGVDVPVEQNLQQSRHRDTFLSKSLHKVWLKKDTHVLGVPSVRGRPDEPVQNHVMGWLLP